MKKVVILGSGGFAIELLSFLQTDNKYQIFGFVSSDLSLKGKKINGVPVLGDDNILEYLIKDGVTGAFVAIGNGSIRKLLYKKICDLGFDPINVIHPSAVIASMVSLGRGVIIYPNVTVNTNVKIGNSVLINSNATIGHDVEIGDFVNINPGVNVAGKVVIERGAFIGIGASIIENITIGTESIIGAGAVVIRNIPSKVVAAGVPAKVIKNIE